MAHALVVKVCGITRVPDALEAARLGATAIGCVFWPESPRAVTPAQARDIVGVLPPFVAVVGVFVNQPRAFVLDVASSVPLTAVQFHGDESDEEVVACGWRVLRAVSLERPGSTDRLTRLPRSVTIVLDAHDDVRRGGTGRTIGWTEAARVAAARRVLLAGGLTAENVGEAVDVVRPWGVDVSSGVERAPGVKDAAKMRDFFAAVRAAETQLEEAEAPLPPGSSGR